MKGRLFLFAVTMFVSFVPCLSAQRTPDWVNNLERVYPSRDWIAVVAEGPAQAQAEAAAMSALARVFRTDVSSLSHSAQRYTQVTSGSTGGITFNESRNFQQEVNLNSNIRGLIGIRTEVFILERTPGNMRPAAGDNRTYYVLARMNRRECSARYSAMIKENSSIINRLLTSASQVSVQGSFSAYRRLSFAYSIAQVTDNLQLILEVLDSSAVNQKPAYGSANAIKVKMLEAASFITIGINVNTNLSPVDLPLADKVLLTRAAGSFFMGLGFNINEQGTLVPGHGSYVFSVNARFEEISQSIFSCRYYLNAALTDENDSAIFSFTEDDRKAHPNNAQEARRLAVRAAEESFKEGKFAKEFELWLMRNE